MGKIFNSFEALFKEALREMKNDPTSKRLNAYKNLKSKMQEYKTSKEGAKVCNANNGEIPDAQEIVIIKKYVKELLGDMEAYKNTNVDLYTASEVEYNYLKDFLPAEASETDIKNVVEQWFTTNNVDPATAEPRMMGQIIGYVKNTLSNADGSLVASVVKSYINK